MRLEPCLCGDCHLCVPGSFCAYCGNDVDCPDSDLCPKCDDANLEREEDQEADIKDWWV